MWQWLRGGALGVRFRRQHPIGHYVLDFYCAQVRLAVEIDGAIHDGQEGYDQYRDDWFASQGIRVLRIPDEDVREDIEAVLEMIRRALK